MPSHRFLLVVLSVLLSVLSSTYAQQHYTSASDYHNPPVAPKRQPAPGLGVVSPGANNNNNKKHNNNNNNNNKTKHNKKRTKRAEQQDGPTSTASLRGSQGSTATVQQEDGQAGQTQLNSARDTETGTTEQGQVEASTTQQQVQLSTATANTGTTTTTPSTAVHSLVDAMQTAQQSYQAVTSATTMAQETTTKLTNFTNTLTAMNATALSLSACQKVELATEFLTRLDLQFNRDTLTLELKHSHWNHPEQENAPQQAVTDVYAFLVVWTPLCLGLLVVGSVLVLPTCVLAAALLGVFAVFHFVDPMIHGGLDCSMKLAASLIVACLAAMAATTCLRFGLFSLGTLAAGGATYLLLDAFPALDVGATTTRMDGDVSAVAWIMVVTMGLVGGWAIRWYEQASLEFLTAALGGMGCAYNIHALVVVQGGQLDRAMVFLLAFFLTVIGWRCQRRRRLKYATYYSDQRHAQQQQQQPQVGSKWQTMPISTTSTPPHNNPQSWQELQSSLHSMQGLLHPQQPPTAAAIASAEQISELTIAMNKFLDRVSPSLSPTGDPHHPKAANKDS